jgi:hypothetical protein
MLTDAQVKPAFHQLIDTIDNKEYLRELYDSIVGLLLIKGDILDGLTQNVLERTQQAIKQGQVNETLSDDLVRLKIAQKWNIQ